MVDIEYMEGDFMNKYKYSKEGLLSHTLGGFPSLELLDKRPDLVEKVYVHEDFYEKDRVFSLCKDKNIRCEVNSRAVNRLARKDNTLLVAIFRKFEGNLASDKDHIVLNEVSDMGNLGTIIRSMNGFDFRDLVLVGNCCDIFNPKVVRASMGSIFDMRIRRFKTIEDYLKDFPGRDLYLFMLSNDLEDSLYRIEKADRPFSLVFGNEGSGLPSSYSSFGRRVFIPQSDRVDSFNLPIACSIAMYEFRR